MGRTCCTGALPHERGCETRICPRRGICRTRTARCQSHRGPSLFVVSNDLKFGHPVTATISARYLWALSKNSKRMRHDLSILGTGFLGLSDLGHFPKKANECDTTCPFWARGVLGHSDLGTGFWTTNMCPRSRQATIKTDPTRESASTASQAIGFGVPMPSYPSYMNVKLFCTCLPYLMHVVGASSFRGGLQP